jgi:hypothetical protein
MMKKWFVIISLLLTAQLVEAQPKNIVGIVVDSLTNEPVIGASVLAEPGGKIAITDERGRFRILNLAGTLHRIIVSASGYENYHCKNLPFLQWQTIMLCRKQAGLANVVISTSAKSPYKIIAETDIAIRGVSHSQEVLRIVPGLFIGQHQGGGKAEQIFLRGVDNDHGTDINIQADGMPVNMVSHAHGQGYADSHFIIPETIEQVVFTKGPYNTERGDGAITGNLEFLTTNRIKNNVIKVEGGQYQTYRAVAMINLLPGKTVSKASWYAASEYKYSNSYFDNPQHFKRFNFFTKFTYCVSRAQTLTISASTFWSRWAASGQLPERAIDSGYVSYFGALDSTEGGETFRTNVNLQFTSFLRNGDRIKNQLYYSRYGIDLHSNFTFFLHDPVNGDAIRQRENRHLLGYSGSWIGTQDIGTIKATTTAGVNIRFDATNGTELSHTKDRYILLKREKFGDITQLGSGVYLSETLRFDRRWIVEGSLRYDHFYYRYHNRLEGDTSFAGLGKYKAQNQKLSPKLNIRYQAVSNAQVYLSLGKGFHTNDARVVVKESGNKTAPSALGADIGILCKPVQNVFLQAAVWYMHLQQEFVYGGDGGTVEFNGRTQRIGFDVSGRYQPQRRCILMWM